MCSRIFSLLSLCAAHEGCSGSFSDSFFYASHQRNGPTVSFTAFGFRGALGALGFLGASCSGSPFIRSSRHRQAKDPPRIFSGSSIPMIAFRAASFRLLVDAEPMRLALLSDVRNWEDLFSASRMMRYSAARRCFRVISSNFSGRFLSSFSTSFDEDWICVPSGSNLYGVGGYRVDVVLVNDVARHTGYEDSPPIPPFEFIPFVDKVADNLRLGDHVLAALSLLVDGLLIVLHGDPNERNTFGISIMSSSGSKCFAIERISSD